MRKFDLQLRALRTKKGLTLTELAEKIGSNYQAVGRWERGTTEQLEKARNPLASALGESTDTGAKVEEFPRKAANF